MKLQKKSLSALLVLSIGLLPAALNAQVLPKIDNMRSYGQQGINVFEDPKDTVTTPFEGIRFRLGAGFTQQFQNLKHKNPDALNNNVGQYVADPGTTIVGNKLRPITSGFQLAQANLFMDAQLADGIRLNVTSYMSSKHHNEFWVKGGFIQFDKLPFEGKFWDDLMKIATIKVGHYEVNYGDAHYRRSDGGQALWNPFMENNIIDAFSTEIGGEVLLRKNGLFGMVAVTNGLLRGGVDSLFAASNPDGKLKKQPSIILKAGFDKKLSQDLRVRVSGSYYGNQSSGASTLYSGDRSGSNYQNVMEKNMNNASGTQGSAFLASGRLDPGFGKKVNAFMFNGLVKYQGLEVFGTYETAAGRTAAETKDRNFNQYAVDVIYRFLQNEKLFVGGRYNAVSAELRGIANKVKVDRVAFAGGWFLTPNVLLKGEYVIQKYKDFPPADYRAGGKFNGYVIEAVVGF
ncbi:hypothetical protein [Filimonas effusa]|uniref:Porin n=1 Tax=Filimonas effusa TaxID=2508721 RepID=A0A4Q1DD92_9BACT|nr:hypothetical protein [Filimonas effusa]RXK86938.1 hypothetical protein ESB13_09175 [Filimonas effusa]